MIRKFSNGYELNSKILEGINKLTDNVAATLGPKGRNVILFHKEQGVPVITKDGVTVAKFVELEDPFENVGAQIVKQAAEQSASKAGDGTTTATVLTRAMLQRAQKYLTAGVSPIEIKRGMDKASDAIVERLKEVAIPIRSEEDIRHIATISANNDKAIGKLIATAVDSAGKDGSVLVEEARSLKTSLDMIEGFRFDSGYLSSTFINNERNGTVEYENPLIAVTDEKIETIEQILPTLELAARDNRPLLIVADMEGQALAADRALQVACHAEPPGLRLQCQHPRPVGGNRLPGRQCALVVPDHFPLHAHAGARIRSCHLPPAAGPGARQRGA